MADGMTMKLRIKGSDKVQRELKQTGKAAGTMGKGMKGATSSAAGLGMMIGPQGLLVVGAAAVTGGFLIAAKAAETLGRAYVSTLRKTVELSEQLDTVGKKARSIGADPESFQALIGAFSLAGVESGQAMKALQKLNQSMGEAMKGTKSYTDAFDAMNLSAEKLARTPLTERMLLISQGMADMGTKAEQSAAGSLLMGRTFKDLIVAFEGGRAGLQDGIDDIERFGIASNEAVRDSEELQDALLRMNKAAFGLKVEALEPLIGTLTGVANGFSDIIVELDPKAVREFGQAVSIMTGKAAVGVLRLANHFSLMMRAASPSGWLEWAKEGDKQGAARLKALTDAIEAARIKAGAPLPIPTSPEITFGADYDKPDKPDPGKPDKPSAAEDPGKSAAERQREADERALEQFRKSTRSRLEVARLAHEERVAMIQRTVEDQIEAYTLEGQSYERFMNTKKQLFDELMSHERAEREEMNRIQEEALSKQSEAGAESALGLSSAYGDAFGAMSGMVDSFRNLSIKMMGEESKESKKAAKVMFGISQSLAIAQATVAMFAAIGEANKLGYPLSIPAMITAGATGATQIAGIVATSIGAVGDAGLTPEMVNQAISAGHSTVMINRGEAVIDPVGTRAISEMLQQRASGEPVTVNTVLEIDGQVLGQTVDQHLIRSAERGLPYGERMRYGSR